MSLLVEETFEYPSPGPKLNSQNGGYGWSGAWSAWNINSSNPVIDATNWSYTDVDNNDYLGNDSPVFTFKMK